MRDKKTSLLVRDIDPTLKRPLAGRARAHRRSLSEEAKALIRRGIAEQPRQLGMGTRLFSIIPGEWRGDDLTFDLPEDAPEPAQFG